MGNKHGKKKGKHRKDKANSAPVGIASPTNNGGGNRAAAATAAAMPMYIAVCESMSEANGMAKRSSFSERAMD